MGSVSDAPVRAGVAIIGAGPAGLATAAALVRRGIACAVFDDNVQGGGQYFRQVPPGFAAPAGDPVPRDPRARDSLTVLAHPLVAYHPLTTVWSMPEPLTIAHAGPGGGGRLTAAAIVVATGAHDRPCPFPGWTLPGVVSAGGCLNLLKGQAMLPGKRVAVVGNGPLVLVAAYSLHKAGAEVALVAEAAMATRNGLRAWAGMARAPGLLAKGIIYRAGIRTSGAIYREGWVAAEAHGTDCVTAVTVARLGPGGSPDPAERLRVDVDALVVGYGLAPSGEFARMLGCGHRFEPSRGGWIVNRSDEFETDVPGVFVVGDAAGIGGAEIALAEGRLIGSILARRIAGGASVAGAERRKLARLERFRTALEGVYALPRPLDLARSDTIVCRCEDVTKQRIVEAAQGRPDLSWIKVATRMSMGRCQGRNCLGPAARITAEAGGLPEIEATWPRMRPPVRPVPIEALLSEELGPPRSPDLVEPSFAGDAAA